MASSNQGGSILSFLLIGGILTVLLVGGAYAVQRRVAQPAATAPTATQLSDDKKVAVEADKDAAAQEAAKKEEVAKKAEQQKAAAKQEAEKKEVSKPAVSAPVAPPTATELPKTGLAESFSAVVGLGLLTGVTAAYVRSRSRTATL